MTKPVSIALVVVVIAAVLGGGYVLMNRDDDSSNSASSGQNETSQAEGETEEGTESEASFATISSSGKAQQCTFNYTGANGTGTGTMFADGKGRGLMNIKTTSENGNSGETNTLVTADKAYTWFSASGQTLGFVYERSAFENNPSNQTDSASGTDPSQNFTMNCKSWSVDEGTLTPPSDVNFTSFSIPS